ncbi:MAG: isochorismatase family protein [Alphaproteobacteria bacterium]|nr:isochorismatase family protein [Alphaproteobacteria bacterium]
MDTLVLSGMQTQIYVQITAADAYFRGVQCDYNSKDSLFHKKKRHTGSIKWIKNYFAKIMSMDEFLSYVKGE